MMRLHASITTERLLNAVSRRNTTLADPGICIACGEERLECEPDAEKYKCESCGKRQVYAPEMIILGVVG